MAAFLTKKGAILSVFFSGIYFENNRMQFLIINV
jgi:hypothetical protein